MANYTKARQLADFGWTKDFQMAWDGLDIGTMQLKPARIVAHFGTSLKIALPDIQTAELSGRLAHYIGLGLVPTVGDWVAVRLSDTNRAVIEAVVPRRSEIARKAAGNRTTKQVIAANVDVAFVILAAGNDNDFNLERLQRFVYQLSIGRIQPVLIVNKADQADITTYISRLQPLQLPVVICAAATGLGLDDVRGYIPAGQTAVLLGSSGAGKSTLTNRLLGREAQLTQSVRESDAAGRHTTVHRELFILPNGGMLIDTPGVREIQLWGTQDDLDDDFNDIAELIRRCAYSSCRHGNEQGCAIRQALDNRMLSAARYASYQKMKVELAGLQAKRETTMQWRNKKARKSIRRQIADDRQAINEVYDTDI